jgi:hypothetical protein
LSIIFNFLNFVCSWDTRWWIKSKNTIRLILIHHCQNPTEVIKGSVLDSANEVIQIQKYKTYNEWWNKECRIPTEKNNEARMKCMNRRTRANQEDYIQKRKIANDICKWKKKAWLNNRIKEVGEMICRKFIKKLSPLVNNNLLWSHCVKAQMEI